MTFDFDMNHHGSKERLRNLARDSGLLLPIGIIAIWGLAGLSDALETSNDTGEMLSAPVDHGE